MCNKYQIKLRTANCANSEGADKKTYNISGQASLQTSNLVLLRSIKSNLWNCLKTTAKRLQGTTWQWGRNNRDDSWTELSGIDISDAKWQPKRHRSSLAQLQVCQQSKVHTSLCLFIPHISISYYKSHLKQILTFISVSDAARNISIIFKNLSISF